MAANLQLTDNLGASVTTLAESGDPATSPTTPQAFRVFNDNTGGSVDTADNPLIKVLQIDPSDGQAKEQGLEFVDGRYTEIRALGTGSTNSTQQATGFEPVGAGRPFPLDPLPSGEYHDIEIQWRLPGGVNAAGLRSLQVKLDPGTPSTSISMGHSERGRDGVLSGVGNDAIRQRIVGGNVVQNPAGADDEVEMQDEVWDIEGRRYALLQHLETFTNLDGAAAALAAGEGYIAILSLAADGTVTQTKGLKDTLGAPPLPPTAPVDEPLVARVTVDDTLTILNASITQLDPVGGFNPSTSALNLTLGSGHSSVNNFLVRRTATTPLSLLDASTNRVWAEPAGSFAVNQSDSPSIAGAVKFFEAVTAGGVVTSLLDLRDFIGGEAIRAQAVQSGTLAAGFLYDLQARRRDCYVRLDGIRLMAGNIGTGNTTGQVVLDVFKGDGAAGWTSLFTSSGTDDRRPELTYNAAAANGVAVSSAGTDGPVVPDVVLVEADRPIRFQLLIPTAFDGTAPVGMVAVLDMEMP